MWLCCVLQLLLRVIPDCRTSRGQHACVLLGWAGVLVSWAVPIIYGRVVCLRM